VGVKGLRIRGLGFRVSGSGKLSYTEKGFLLENVPWVRTLNPKS